MFYINKIFKFKKIFIRDKVKDIFVGFFISTNLNFNFFKLILFLIDYY